MDAKNRNISALQELMAACLADVGATQWQAKFIHVDRRFILFDYQHYNIGQILYA